MQKMRVEMAAMKRDAEHYSRQVTVQICSSFFLSLLKHIHSHILIKMGLIRNEEIIASSIVLLPYKLPVFITVTAELSKALNFIACLLYLAAYQLYMVLILLYVWVQLTSQSCQILLCMPDHCGTICPCCVCNLNLFGLLLKLSCT